MGHEIAFNKSSLKSVQQNQVLISQLCRLLQHMTQMILKLGSVITLNLSTFLLMMGRSMAMEELNLKACLDLKPVLLS